MRPVIATLLILATCSAGAQGLTQENDSTLNLPLQPADCWFCELDAFPFAVAGGVAGGVIGGFIAAVTWKP